MKRKMRGSSNTTLVVVLILALVMMFVANSISEKEPEQISENPRVVDPTPVDPKPENIDSKPTNSTELILVSFERDGSAKARGKIAIINGRPVLLCWFPKEESEEETKFFFGMDVELRDGFEVSMDERGLRVIVDDWAINLFGIIPTEDIQTKLDKARRQIGENPNSHTTVSIPAGTIIGTIGAPLNHSKELGDCDLIVSIGTNDDSIVKPMLANILESVTR
jgi:hypothetical protein